MINSISGTLPRIDPLRVDTGFAAPAASAAATGGAPSFASAMMDVAREASEALKGAETASIQGIHGKASTQAVVDAVMGAERTLQTAIAVRDKVVSAYLELSRMSI